MNTVKLLSDPKVLVAETIVNLGNRIIIIMALFSWKLSNFFEICITIPSKILLIFA
ncbi:hypothetical protein [Rickettsia conorii]|uniref:hypothetical protein n=1 Tax=Rickettsia conorii TaxID=781 RepID=UPI0022608BB6|nr:hypothetical protein [Rickettsia conorii]UZW38403.1 hypothetical protein OSR38_05445 [Rickettsia conorii subsp. heilongjiangensis]